MRVRGLFVVASAACALAVPAGAQAPAPAPSAVPIITVTVGPPTPPPAPTPVPTLTPTPAPSATPTVRPTAQPFRLFGKRRDPSPSPSPSPSPEPTPVPTAPPTPSPPPPPTPSPTPTISPTPGPLHPAGFESSDNTDELIGGVWTCTTFGGTNLTHVFSRGNDVSSLVVDTTFLFPDHRTAKSYERYQFHVSTNTWTAPLANHKVVGSAPVFTGDSWTFTGQAVVGGKLQRARMIYTRLGNDSYRRDFEQGAQNGGWEVYAGETCRREVLQTP